jgi:hypothetical protein
VVVVVVVVHNLVVDELLVLVVLVVAVLAMYRQQQLLVQLTQAVVAVELMAGIWVLVALVLLLFPSHLITKTLHQLVVD